MTATEYIFLRKLLTILSIYLDHSNVIPYYFIFSNADAVCDLNSFNQTERKMTGKRKSEPSTNRNQENKNAQIQSEVMFPFRSLMYG